MHEIFEEMTRGQTLLAHLALGGVDLHVVERTLRMLHPVGRAGVVVDFRKASQWEDPEKLAPASEAALALPILALDMQAWLAQAKLFAASAATTPRRLLEVACHIVRINAKLAATKEELRIFPRIDERGGVMIVVCKTGIAGRAIKDPELVSEENLLARLSAL